MKHLVSILMPVKNAAPYLRACLNSIVNQDFKDWELIAVDDHSSDESFEILSEYAENDSRIQCLRNEGEGVIQGLRKAYANSKGDLIHRMDADDLMPVSKLTDLFQSWKAKGSGHIATGKVQYFSEEGLKAGYQKYAKWLNHLVDQNSHWQDLYKECVIASPNWLISRTDLDKCDAFNPDIYPEDYDLVFRFYQAGLKVVSCNSVTHLWRDHAQRSSRTMEIYKNNAYFELKWMYFKKLDLDQDRPLMVWGAGPKGKQLARHLKQEEVDFEWVSNNPKKHGKEIYDQILASFREILEKDHPQILIAVAKRNAQKDINQFLNNHGYTFRKDYYFFC